MLLFVLFIIIIKEQNNRALAWWKIRFARLTRYTKQFLMIWTENLMIGNESSDFRWLLAHAVKLSHSRKEKPKSLIWCALMMIASPVCDLFKRDKYQLFSWCVSCHRSIHLIFFFLFCFFFLFWGPFRPFCIISIEIFTPHFEIYFSYRYAFFGSVSLSLSFTRVH